MSSHSMFLLYNGNLLLIFGKVASQILPAFFVCVYDSLKEANSP